jgi:hypothetical protein
MSLHSLLHNSRFAKKHDIEECVVESRGIKRLAFVEINDDRILQHKLDGVDTQLREYRVEVVKTDVGHVDLDFFLRLLNTV